MSLRYAMPGDARISRVCRNNTMLKNMPQWRECAFSSSHAFLPEIVDKITCDVETRIPRMPRSTRRTNDTSRPHHMMPAEERNHAIRLSCLSITCAERSAQQERVKKKSAFANVRRRVKSAQP